MRSTSPGTRSTSPTATTTWSRALDLNIGALSLFAGDFINSGTGDNVPATNTSLSYPYWVAVSAGSPPTVYVNESVSRHIHKIDGATHIISSVLAESSCGGTLKAIALTNNSPSVTAGSMAVDQKGSLFVSGVFCGSDTGNVNMNGVARLNADGSLTLVVGGGGGPPTAGLSALAVSLTEAPVIAFDTPVAGQTQSLYLSVPAGNYLARVDGATQRLDQIAGTGTSGSSGNFGAATAATFNLPLQIALRPGSRDLYVAEGTTYGVGMVAGANSPLVTSASLSAGAVPASVYPDQVQAVGAVVKDGSGLALAGRPVTFALDPGQLPGGWLWALRALSGGTGLASVTAGAGLAPGTYGVLATATDLHGTALGGSPVSLSVSAAAPPSGLVFSVVNQSHLFTGTTKGIPGPGVLAQIYLPRAAAVASTGVVYFSDGNRQIYQMLPSGLASVLVPAFPGFDPYGLTLDESKGVLYVGDNSGYVRAVSLANGAVTLVAGGGSSNADGPATATTLYQPSRVLLAGGKIYLSDRPGTAAAARLRRIDPVAGTIETFLANSSSTALPAAPTAQSCPSASPAVFYACNVDPGCSVAVAPPPDGRLYVSGNFCGAGALTTPGPAIVRVELNGNLTPIAALDALPALATDAAGNLYVAKAGGTSAHFGYYAAADVGNAVPPSPMTFHPMAQGTVGAEYVDQALTAFSYPVDVVFGAGHIWVSDSDSKVNALRVIR